MNISVLDFFKFASGMPQIAQILVSTFKIFWGSMPPDPPRNFLFFFHEQFQALFSLVRQLLLELVKSMRSWRRKSGKMSG